MQTLIKASAVGPAWDPSHMGRTDVMCFRPGQAVNSDGAPLNSPPMVASGRELILRDFNLQMDLPDIGDMIIVASSDCQASAFAGLTISNATFGAPHYSPAGHGLHLHNLLVMGGGNQRKDKSYAPYLPMDILLDRVQFVGSADGVPTGLFKDGNFPDFIVSGCPPIDGSGRALQIEISNAGERCDRIFVLNSPGFKIGLSGWSGWKPEVVCLNSGDPKQVVSVVSSVYGLPQPIWR